MRPIACYVHIPFCRSICPYCDFPKVYYRSDWADSYLDRLLLELSDCPHSEFKTLYFGGGTPTALPLDGLVKALKAFSLRLTPGGEFSVEGNPESFTPELCQALSESGVNRVSIGAQSSDGKLLATLGRTHRFSDVEQAVDNLLSAGINNINLDLIYAAPGEGVDEARRDAESFALLPITHLSAYSLILEQGTCYSARGIKEASQDEQAEQFLAIRDALEAGGFRQYEVSSFERGGHECAHNKEYWMGRHYLGFGMGASGFLPNGHYRNTRSLSRYLRLGPCPQFEQESEQDRIEEYLLTNLRLLEGFELSEFESLFGNKALQSLLAKANKPISEGILKEESGRLFPTKDGILLLDSALVDLF